MSLNRVQNLRDKDLDAQLNEIIDAVNYIDRELGSLNLNLIELNEQLGIIRSTMNAQYVQAQPLPGVTNGAYPTGTASREVEAGINGGGTSTTNSKWFGRK